MEQVDLDLNCTCHLTHLSSFIFGQGYVSEDSTLYGILGIVSVVGVVVCTLLDANNLFVENTCLK